MKAKIDFNGEAYNVELIKGKPLRETPKSYKYLGVFGHNLGHTGLGALYTEKDGSFRYEMYRYGCILPYYGKLVFNGIIDVPVLGDKNWFVLAGKEEAETSGLTKMEAIKMARKLRDNGVRIYIGMNKYVCGDKRYSFCNLNDLIEQL